MSVEIIDIFSKPFKPLEQKPMSILDKAKTPAQWVSILAEKGIHVTERKLKERAYRLGACIKISRSIVITDEHMEIILKDGQKCPSNRTNVAVTGGSRAGSNTKADPSLTTTSGALELLQNKLRGSGAKTRKNGLSGNSSSGRSKRARDR